MFIYHCHINKRNITIPKIWSNSGEIHAVKWVDDHIMSIDLVHSIYKNFSQINPHSFWEFAGFVNRVWSQTKLSVCVLIFINEIITSSAFYWFLRQTPVLHFSWGFIVAPYSCLIISVPMSNWFIRIYYLTSAMNDTD